MALATEGAWPGADWARVSNRVVCPCRARRTVPRILRAAPAPALPPPRRSEPRRRSRLQSSRLAAATAPGGVVKPKGHSAHFSSLPKPSLYAPSPHSMTAAVTLSAAARMKCPGGATQAARDAAPAAAVVAFPGQGSQRALLWPAFHVPRAQGAAPSPAAHA